MLSCVVELNVSKGNNSFYHFSLKYLEREFPKGIIIWNLANHFCSPQWVNLEHSTPKPALVRFLWEFRLTPWNNWNVLGKPHFQSESSQVGCRDTRGSDHHARGWADLPDGEWKGKWGRGATLVCASGNCSLFKPWLPIGLERVKQSCFYSKLQALVT